jgi:hypothetical protein
VIQLAFLVACMYTGVGVLRLGFMVRFLSHSVITGFTSGEDCFGWQVHPLASICATETGNRTCWAAGLLAADDTHDAGMPCRAVH